MTVDTWEVAVDQVLDHETKWGITKRDRPDLDIPSLTRAQAKDIFRRDWWDRYGFYRIEHDAVAIKLFDMAVNMGAATAIRLIQQVVNYLTPRRTEIQEDGMLGPETLRTINAADPEILVLALRAYAAKRCIELVEGPDPRFETFDKRGLKRALG